MDKIAFTIISINDSRADNKAIIRERVDFPEVFVPAVNGRDPKNLDIYLDENPWVRLVGLWNRPKQGELGIWLSQLNCWRWIAESQEYDALIVFEDDAIICEEGFRQGVLDFIDEVPSEFDFIALWVPDNQRGDYYYNVEYDSEGMPGAVRHAPATSNDENSVHNFGSPTMAIAYQGYGCVATLYTKRGGQRLIDRLKDLGVYTPVDCFLYLQTHAMKIDGYAPKPFVPQLVWYNWSVQTTVQDTPLYDRNTA